MITITHTHADGTLIEGSSKGDGVWPVLKDLRDNWRYFPSIGAIGIGQSRDRNAHTYKIERAAKALRAAGFEVTVTIDEGERRTFAEAEADRIARAAERAGRMSEYAGNAAARSAAGFARTDQILSAIPMGQPVLVGHHSEARHRRDLARADAGMRTGIDEGKKAEHYEHRAENAANYQAHRESVPTTMRRIEKLEAEARQAQRRLDGTDRYWSYGTPAAGSYRERLTSRLADITDEVAHWRKVIADQADNGVKVWSADDFAKGDFVQCFGTWYEVLRVNTKSVTIPAMISAGPIVTRANSRLSWTDTRPYHKVTGRKSAADMAEILAEANRREAAAAS